MDIRAVSGPVSMFEAPAAEAVRGRTTEGSDGTGAPCLCRG